MIRQKLTKTERASAINLITAFVYFREVLTGLVKENVSSNDDFNWQMLFKFRFKNLENQIQMDKTLN
jgi:dynein heavy chain